MKSAAEYLENHVFEARRPRRDLQPVVALSDAVQAIEQALADAEKYKYLLMRALRRHVDTPAPAPAVAAPASPSYFLEDVVRSCRCTRRNRDVWPPSIWVRW